MTMLGQTRKGAQRSIKNCTFSATQPTKIATWNVRTLFQTGKMAQVCREFLKYKLYILGLTETRWTGSCKIQSDGTTLLYSGAEEEHHRGVGIMLNKEAANALIGWKPFNSRIITARFKSRHSKRTVVTVYAPTEDASEDDKDEFYQHCQEVLSNIPSHDIVVLMGDFNAQISSDRRGIETVVGPYGSANATNDNGERMIMLCNINGLCIGNTYFSHKKIHKKTWRSPGGQVENEIDYICISKRWRSSLNDVRVCRGADVGSDHHLVRGTVHLKLKKIEKPQTIRPFAVETLKDKNLAQQYSEALSNRFLPLLQANDCEEQWTIFTEAMTIVANEHLGRRRGSKKEMWIQEATWNLIDERKRSKQHSSKRKQTSSLKYFASNIVILTRQ